MFWFLIINPIPNPIPSLEVWKESFPNSLFALRTMSVRPFGIIVGSSGALGRAYAPILSSSSCINGLYKGLIGREKGQRADKEAIVNK